MSARFVPTQPEHVKYIAANMRECDRLEVWASSHHSPIESLRESVSLTDQPETILVHGVPAAICGVAAMPDVANVGVPWMLGTGAVETAPLAFGRICLEWIGRKRRQWPLLINYTDARATRTHRWLEWLGFTLADPEPFGAENMPFRRFEMGA